MFVLVNEDRDHVTVQQWPVCGAMVQLMFIFTSGVKEQSFSFVVGFSISPWDNWEGIMAVGGRCNLLHAGGPVHSMHYNTVPAILQFGTILWQTYDSVYVILDVSHYYNSVTCCMSGGHVVLHCVCVCTKSSGVQVY